jgi:hypothetical protein
MDGAKLHSTNSESERVRELRLHRVIREVSEMPCKRI